MLEASWEPAGVRIAEDRLLGYALDDHRRRCECIASRLIGDVRAGVAAQVDALVGIPGESEPPEAVRPDVDLVHGAALFGLRRVVAELPRGAQLIDPIRQTLQPRVGFDGGA